MAALLMTRPLSAIGVACTLLVSPGCGSHCEEYGAPGVIVHVTDSATGGPICDATVTATVNGDTKTLTQSDASACSYSGGFYEVSSTYVMTASRAGYASATSEVDIKKGECHVETQEITISLTPTQ